MRNFRKIAALTLAATMILSTTACHKAKTINDYIASSEKITTQSGARFEIEQLNHAYRDEIAPFAVDDWCDAFLHYNYRPTNDAMFEALYDAVDSVALTCDISSFNASVNDFNYCRAALLDRAELQFFYLKDVTLSADGKVVSFAYNYLPENIPEMKQALYDEIYRVFNVVVQPGYSMIEKALAVYSYLTGHAVNVEQTDSVEDQVLNSYALLTAGQASSEGFAYLYNFVMWKLGIDCVTLCSEQHYWNMINFDGAWYHVDASWDADAAHPGLRFFMQSDSTRAQSLDGNWSVVSPAYQDQMPTADSNQYSFFSDFSAYALAFDEDAVYYSVYSTETVSAVHLITGETEVVLEELVSQLAYYGGKLYYSSNSDGGLRAFDTSKKTTEDVDVSRTVGSFYIKDGALYSTDIYGENEKKFGEAVPCVDMNNAVRLTEAVEMSPTAGISFSIRLINGLKEENALDRMKLLRPDGRLVPYTISYADGLYTLFPSDGTSGLFSLYSVK